MARKSGTMLVPLHPSRGVIALCAVILTLALPGSRAAKGYFRLGGLFPRFKTEAANFSKDTSGIKRLSGFVLAVHEINNNSTILPNHTIVTSVLDSKRDDGQAFFQALKLVQDHRVEAIVGPASSGPTMAAGLVAARFKIPAISYSATSPTLSDAKTYPFSLRTPPSDAYQGVAMANMIRKTFDWTQIVTVAGTDAYGSAGIEAFTKEASNVGINIMASVSISKGQTNYDTQIETIRKGASKVGVEPRLFLIFAQVSTAIQFIKKALAVKLINEHTTIWGSDALKKDELTGRDGVNATKIKGMFVLSPSAGEGTSRYKKLKSLYHRYATTAPEHSNTQGNDTACHNQTDTGLTGLQGGHNYPAKNNYLWQAPVVDPNAFPPAAAEPNCNIPAQKATECKCAGVNFTAAEFDSYTPFSYDAVWAIASAAHAFYERMGQDHESPTGEQLKEELLKISLPDAVTGPLQFLSRASTNNPEKEGDRDGGVAGVRYDLYNHDGGAWGRVGVYEYRKSSDSHREYNPSDHSALHPDLQPNDQFWPCRNKSATDGSYELTKKAINACPEGRTSSVVFATSTAIGAKALDAEKIIPWCGPGKYCPVDKLYACPRENSISAGTCDACPLGRYMPSAGKQTSCSLCPLTGYSDVVGAEQCKQCYPNSKTESIGAQEKDECVCNAGFYSSESFSNKVGGFNCTECPHGAHCRGRYDLPYPVPGFWTPRTNKSNRIEFFACAGGSTACPGWRLATQDQTKPALVQQAKDRAFDCGVGYNGTMCNTCVDGYFKFTSDCLNCVDSFSKAYAVVYVFVLGGMIIVWISLNKLVAANLDAVDVSLLFLQVLDMIGKFELDWPEGAVGIFKALTFVNFNVDLVSPQCISSYGFVEQWVLGLLMPVFALTILGVNYGYCHLKHRMASKKQEEEKQVQVKWKSLKQNIRKSNQIDWKHVAQKEQSVKEETWQQKWFVQAIFTFSSFLNIVYPSLALSSFSVFRCSDVGGISVLMADPTIECGTSQHAGLKAGGVLGILIYVVGIPAFFVSILYRGVKHRLFDTQHYRNQYGWLFMRFESEYYFWELTFACRRLAFVLLSVFIDDPAVQAVFALFALAVGTMMHFYARPFAAVQLDILESVSLALLFAITTVGYFFHVEAKDQALAAQLGSWRQMFEIFVLLLMTIAFLQMCRSITQNVLRIRHRAHIHKQVGLKCDERTWAHVAAFCETFEESSLSRWMRSEDCKVKNFEYVAHSMSHINRIDAGLTRREVEQHELRKRFYRHLAKALPETIDYLVCTNFRERTECAKTLRKMEFFYVKSNMPEGTEMSHVYSRLFDEEGFQNVVQWLVHHATEERNMFLFTQIMRSMMTGKARRTVETKSRGRTFKMGSSFKLSKQDKERKSQKVTPLEAALAAAVSQIPVDTPGASAPSSSTSGNANDDVVVDETRLPASTDA